jgi:acetolactate synthase-1/3 small subunit
MAQGNDMHVFSLVTNDHPGVLVRIALVFARRGFNIESLAVSPGATAGFARFTITSRGHAEAREQMIKQLAKLVDVVYVTDHAAEKAVEAEIGLVKLRCAGKDRERALAIAGEHKAEMIDESEDTIILRAHGDSAGLSALCAALEAFGLEELVRSGPIVMDRGASHFAHLLGSPKQGPS